MPVWSFALALNGPLMDGEIGPPGLVGSRAPIAGFLIKKKATCAMTLFQSEVSVLKYTHMIYLVFLFCFINGELGE